MFFFDKTYQIVSNGSRVNTSVPDSNLDFKMRKVQRYAKQKNAVKTKNKNP